jgi:hypothetical protein
MVVSELITNIRTESRIPGTDNLDDWILNIVNQVTLNFAEKGMLRQLLVKSFPVTLVDAQESYDLPEDYLKMLRIFYVSEGLNWVMYERKGIQQPAKIDGKPSTYECIVVEDAPNILNLTPSSEILDTDGLFLDYYKTPTVLEADDDYPFPSLEPALIRAAITRVQLFHEDMEVSTLQQQGADTEFNQAEPTTR